MKYKDWDGTRKKLTESQIKSYIPRVSTNPFFDLVRKHLEESQLDAADAGLLGYVWDEVWKKAEPFLSREVLRTVMVTDESVKFPIPTAAVATDLSGGTYGTAGESYAYGTLSVDKNKGINPLWTREFIELVTFDAVSRQVSECGRAIEEQVMGDIITEFDAIAVADQAGGATLSISGTITWPEFVSGISTIEGEDFHPDIVVVGPALYGELLGLQQFIDASYRAENDPIKTGVISTTFGVKVIRSSKATADRIYYVDSTALGALGILRDITVEPYERPETNKYGLVVSMRYGIKMLQKKAFVVGQR